MTNKFNTFCETFLQEMGTANPQTSAVSPGPSQNNTVPTQTNQTSQQAYQKTPSPNANASLQNDQLLELIRQRLQNKDKEFENLLLQHLKGSQPNAITKPA